jgi:hypothetical protein
MAANQVKPPECTRRPHFEPLKLNAVAFVTVVTAGRGGEFTAPAP